MTMAEASTRPMLLPLCGSVGVTRVSWEETEGDRHSTSMGDCYTGREVIVMVYQKCTTLRHHLLLLTAAAGV